MILEVSKKSKKWWEDKSLFHWTNSQRYNMTRLVSSIATIRARRLRSMSLTLNSNKTWNSVSSFWTLKSDLICNKELRNSVWRKSKKLLILDRLLKIKKSQTRPPLYQTLEREYVQKVKTSSTSLPWWSKRFKSLKKRSN